MQQADLSQCLKFPWLLPCHLFLTFVSIRQSFGFSDRHASSLCLITWRRHLVHLQQICFIYLRFLDSPLLYCLIVWMQGFQEALALGCPCHSLQKVVNLANSLSKVPALLCSVISFSVVQKELVCVTLAENHLPFVYYWCSPLKSLVVVCSK